MRRRYDAVLFDLLTALLDSWSLWNDVAGDEAAGLRWRREYLRLTYGTAAYRPYEILVAQAAVEVGLAPRLADELAKRYGELRAWPGVAAELSGLAAAGVKLGVATNCSEALGAIAAARVGVRFDVLVTAERAGSTSPTRIPIAWRSENSAPSRHAVCSSPAPPMIWSGRRRSGSTSGGTTVSA